MLSGNRRDKMNTLDTRINEVLSEIEQGKPGNIFITGRAGTGKTTFLKYLTKNSTKKLVVVAPTGVAAVNAGGVTIHSLFALPLGISFPDTIERNPDSKKKKILRFLEVLIIDEISMVRPEVLDSIDWRLRKIRRNQKPFGGVKVIMFGDLFQLPPVIKDSEWQILREYYPGQFFFNAHVWRKTTFKIIELTQVFRQTNPEFIEILNDIREYNPKPEDLRKLRELSGKPWTDEYINLCALRSDADWINNDKLGDKGIETHTGECFGQFPESSSPAPYELSLRVGARVMCLINDYNGSYFNGSLGTVTGIDFPVLVKVKLDSGDEVYLYEHTWENKEYLVDKATGRITQNTIGSFTQFPLKLAWAITIHKSQGLTFDHVRLNVKNIFSSGQLYVALSRCTSLSGISTDSEISPSMIIPNSELVNFVNYIKGREFFGGFDLPQESLT